LGYPDFADGSTLESENISILTFAHVVQIRNYSTHS
jgi:hypothetical protein